MSLRCRWPGVAALAILLPLPGQQTTGPELGPPPVAPQAGKIHERAAAEPAREAANWYDTSSRSEVQSLYNSVYLPASSVPMNWTGSVATGDPGTTAQAYKDAVAAIINWNRGMAGVPMGITLDTTYNGKDQKAALMFAANNALSHSPPTSWKWYTAEGAEAAGKSNICMWSSGMPTGCIDSYMRDDGSNNTAVGHRRWILYPQTRTMGTGDVSSTSSNPSTNALWVITGDYGTTRPATREPYVGWPSKGYFPYNMVPSRWSFSYPGATFSSATVTVTRGGVDIPVTLVPVANGYGENTLVWTLTGWNFARPSADSTVTVTVNNVTIGGATQSFSYQVIVFDPTGTFAFAPSSASSPAAGGTGSTQLQVSPSTASWTVVSSAAWLKLTSAASGTGTATLNYSVDPNPGSSSRTATLTTANAVFTLTQSPAAANSTPVAVSVSPNSGSLPAGATSTIQAVFSDGNGASDLRSLQLRLNATNTAAGGCDLTLNRSSNQLALSDDAGLSGPSAILGSNASLMNSKCAVYTASSSASSNGNNVTLALAVRFLPQFAGTKTAYARAVDASGGDSGWQTMGTLSITAPIYTLGRYSLNFGAAGNGAIVTRPQQVTVTVSGPGVVNWSVTSDQPWLAVSPATGSGTGSFTVSISSVTIPAPATLDGTVTVTAQGVANSQQTVRVNLNSMVSNATTAPFGAFDTPASNASGLAGNVPVTGWALDDIEVQKVTLWRDRVGTEPVYSNGLVYIGDAVFVPEARSDVEGLYPNRPVAYRGGWGYLMLTNGLPPTPGFTTKGNGVYRLHAYAVDLEGKQTLLSSKSVTVSNATSNKPFGSIDTPNQGETVSGSAYVNFGWALTPQPAIIPTDGSTVGVSIDGVFLPGRPTYGLFRDDIATGFPGYANSTAGVGYYIVDTTQLSNGLHNIGWLVTDDAGRTEGIGSRFFSVFNTGTQAPAAGPNLVLPKHTRAVSSRLSMAPDEPPSSGITFRKGYDRTSPLQPASLDHEGHGWVIEAEELERIELQLPRHVLNGMAVLRVGTEARPLPPGSTWNEQTGRFYWQLGPGQLGAFSLAWTPLDDPGSGEILVVVRVRPKFTSPSN